MIAFFWSTLSQRVLGNLPHSSCSFWLPHFLLSLHLIPDWVDEFEIRTLWGPLHLLQHSKMYLKPIRRLFQSRGTYRDWTDTRLHTLDLYSRMKPHTAPWTHVACYKNVFYKKKHFKNKLLLNFLWVFLRLVQIGGQEKQNIPVQQM